ncbi:MAG: ribosomal-protein-alanine N-acetyltransferase [Gammaproteobacteria bacterium]|nr:MAG: ribosomal-protein-alanine N-acetyltransferase [Pseudomonadota bacterium]PIE38531.1 MAG: ribosomal-protein-alanine N-acetyltransferase [Gammaproteobacteria bacterium]
MTDGMTVSSSAWTIRPVCETDVPEILEIEQAGYTHPWSENDFTGCFGQRYHNWLLVDPVPDSNAKSAPIVAYGFSRMTLDEVELLNLCVADRFRGQGAGGKLLRFMIDRSLQVGGKTMFLEVRQSNEVAIALYSAAGFNEIGLRKGYYPAVNGRENAIVMALELAFFSGNPE